MPPRFKSDLRRVLCFLAVAALVTSVPARADDSVTVTPIAVQGQQARGVEGAWVYKYLEVDGIELNQSGQILFSSSLTVPGSTETLAWGTWTGSPTAPSLVGFRLKGAPGTGGTFAPLGHDGIDDAGRMLLRGSPDGLWYGAPGNFAPVAIPGQQAPGLPAGLNVKSINSWATLSRNGHMAFGGSLSGAGVNSTNEGALWAGTADNLSLVARNGAPAPGAGEGVTFSNVAPRYDYGPVVNDRGQTLFVAGVQGPGIEYFHTLRVYFSDAGRLKLIPPVPHQPFYGTFHYSDPVLNNAGQFALLTYESPPRTPWEVEERSNFQLWTGTADGGLTLVAGRDKPVPGVPGTPSPASEPLLNSAGQLLFAWGYGSSRALLRGTSDDLEIVARSGTPAPGTPAGAVFAGFQPIGFNNKGQFVISAGLTGPGVSFSNEWGVWASFAGRLYLVLRQGQAIDLNGQVKTVSRTPHTLSVGGNGEDGRSITFNDLGQMVLDVHFTDGTNAFLLAQLPTTIPGDANLDGIVNSADFQALFANFGKAGDRAAGDFNGDHVITFADFQILEQNFGRAIESLPPVPAAEIAAFEAAAGSVPEPATGSAAMFAGTLLLARRRRSKHESRKHPLGGAAGNLKHK